MKKINIEEVKEALQKEIIVAQRTLEIFLKVESVVKLFEGKKITKRIETKFNSLFPEYQSYLQNFYGSHNLIIFEKDRKKYEFTLGYEKDDSIVKLQGERGFYDNCKCYGSSNIERMNKNILLLQDDKKLFMIVNSFNNFYDSCKEFLNFANSLDQKYLLLNLADLDSTRLPSIYEFN